MDFKLSREQLYIVVGLVVFMLFGLGVAVYNRLKPAENTDLFINQSKQTQQTQSRIMIHITGAVKKEGVYEVKYGDRLLDIIKLAGGAKPEADLNSINLAERVKDGQKIVIPNKIIAQAQSQIAVRENVININIADEKTLTKLDGVGPSTAKKIIKARPFKKIEDIMKIPRFGKKKFEKIKKRIRI